METTSGSNQGVDPHPFVKACLQRAVRALLRDKHGHSTPGDLAACPQCVTRLWVELGKAAPKSILGHGR